MHSRTRPKEKKKERSRDIEASSSDMRRAVPIFSAERGVS
jgi:hypothetical protein